MLRLLERLLPRLLPRKLGGSQAVHCILRFPDSVEGRWFDELPRPGMRIRSRPGDPYRSRVWVVDEVLQSGRATYTVFCVGHDEYLERLRHGSGRRPDMTAELMEAARRAGQAVSEGRRRWKYRDHPR
jgi:hypothetical protein